jgi:hypothetical protein
MALPKMESRRNKNTVPREGRALRRKKQHEANPERASKMHLALMRAAQDGITPRPANLRAGVFVGCSGWFYWKWSGLFYPSEMPTSQWFLLLF